MIFVVLRKTMQLLTLSSEACCLRLWLGLVVTAVESTKGQSALARVKGHKAREAVHGEYTKRRPAPTTSLYDEQEEFLLMSANSVAATIVISAALLEVLVPTVVVVVRWGMNLERKMFIQSYTMDGYDK
jgi:hypothetical protein